MEMIINDRRNFFTIQEEFNALFPYLKLEFFTKPLRSGELSERKLCYGKMLKECRTIQNRRVITITPCMTVVDLEDHFRNVYGIEVQVFRKSGKVWLETTITDKWTLEEQNLQGKALNQSVA